MEPIDTAVVLRDVRDAEACAELYRGVQVTVEEGMERLLALREGDEGRHVSGRVQGWLRQWLQR